MVYKWQQTLFENGQSAFERSTSTKKPSVYTQTISALRDRLALKGSVITEITPEFHGRHQDNVSATNAHPGVRADSKTLR